MKKKLNYFVDGQKTRYATVKGPWGRTILVVLTQSILAPSPDKPPPRGATYIYEEQIEVIIPIDNGYKPATAAHEAVHAAVALIDGKAWREWAPVWGGITYQEEETKAWVVERIVAAATRLARRHKVEICDTDRTDINGHPV
jgi:hypothetical protein